MLIEAINEFRKGKIKQFPINSNRASELGHECLRYLVYNRTRWQERSLHDANLQGIFDDGVMHEKDTLRILQDAGLSIIEQQRSFEWKEYLITGHIDAKVQINGFAYPLEIKTASPFTFNTLNTIDDMKHHKYPYIRRYPAQLTLYLLMDNKEKGLFLFKNKANSQFKEILVNLDYELGESLLKKAEAINKHVKDNTLPDRVEYSDYLCGECPYQHICLPPVDRSELKIIDNTEMQHNLDRYFELKPIVSEYNELDKLIKDTYKEKEVLVGSYLINGKWCEKKEYTVQAGKYWQTKITKVGG